MPCPDYPTNCRVPDSAPRLLSEGERAAVIGKAAEFAREAQRCAYCGLVFVGTRPIQRLGWLESVMGREFHPAQNYQN